MRREPLQQVEEQRHATKRDEKLPYSASVPVPSVSKNASASIDGPSVINRNSNEGGYFVVFKNESSV